MKRIFDFTAAASGLVLLAPLLVAIAALIILTDGLPVFFRQTRVGQNGKPFRILKFRSMQNLPPGSGPMITRRGDSRVTGIGRILRRCKLDELPQLFNVLLGQMSFVGPRPEVQKYVDLYNPEQREVLKLRPGITDLASIEFINEEELLAQCPEPEKYYIEYCMPKKIELNLKYAARASVWTDLQIILATVLPLTGLKKRFL